jgi:predicted lipoprotein with Yx(FWY)xxD motif
VRNIQAMTRGRARGWSALLAATTVAGLVGGSFLAPAASAQTHKKSPKPTVVVKEVTRGSFGEILTNIHMKALYTDNGAACTGSCLSVWPPLVMPKGKTMPAGISGLGTTPFGTGKLQVTYQGKPLYTFAPDTKKTVSGQGVNSFFVVQISSS